MKTILTLGCSNSSASWGKSWPDFLAEKNNFNLVRASSNGAGNSFFIEKLNFILQEQAIDLVVIQLTEPSRVVLGMKSNEKNMPKTNYTDGCSFNNIGCYTWNAWKNNHHVLQMTNIDRDIDSFWLKEVSISEWINYKICQDICTMKYICDSFEKPVIFFSWFVDFDSLFVKEYQWLKHKINYADSWATDFFNKHNLNPVPECDYHYNGDANELLVNEWLLPKIQKFL